MFWGWFSFTLYAPIIVGLLAQGALLAKNDALILLAGLFYLGYLASLGYLLARIIEAGGRLIHIANHSRR